MFSRIMLFQRGPLKIAMIFTVLMIEDFRSRLPAGKHGFSELLVASPILASLSILSGQATEGHNF